MHFKPLRTLTVFALAAAMMLTGCAPGTGNATDMTGGAPNSAEGSVPSDTLEQMIADGLANAKSDFQREVLTKAKTTGEISEADWKEANNQNKECLAAKGFNVEILYEGTKVLVQHEINESETQAQAEEWNQATQTCYEKTSSFINEIYSYLAGDENGQGFDGDTAQRAVLACLIERKLVPADTSYDEFVADLEQNNGKQFSGQGQPNEKDFTQCWVENA